MSSDVQHTDVGAYALGLLEEDDRRSFEAHLAVCEFCIVELADFSGMRELFSGVHPPDEGPADYYAAPDTENVVELLSRRQAADRRSRANRALLGIAAGIALLAGGVTAGATMAPQEQPASKPQAQTARPSETSPLGSGERVSATDPRTKASGTVAMLSKGWGTDIILELSHVRGPQECRLIAVTRKGKGQVVTAWSVPKKGYGLPGSPAPLIVHGGTALERQEISHFEVRLKNGRKLLTVPA